MMIYLSIYLGMTIFTVHVCVYIYNYINMWGNYHGILMEYNPFSGKSPVYKLS